MLIDLAPLRVREFRRLWVGRTFSVFGSQMTLVAVMFQVWQATSSTIWTGAVGLAQAVPLIVCGLVLGPVIDRSDRRRFYLVATLGLAGCSVVLAVQGFAGGLPVAALLAVLAVQSGFGAGAGPVARTFIPALLPRSQVAAGLALTRISNQAAMLAGPALGGLVVGWAGLGTCYLVDAVTFALVFHAAFRLPPLRVAAPSRPGLQGVLDGLRFMARTPSVRGVLLADLATTVLSMPISLFPLVNAQRFGGDPRTLGLFLSAIAVGGVLASLLSGTFTRLPRPGLVMLCGSATWGLALTLFGISANPLLGLVFLAIAGAADTVAVVSRSTVVQLHTPNELLGRVSAAEQIVGQAGPDLGNLRAGLVAGFSSGATALVSGGLMCVAAIGGITATTPALRRERVQA